MKYITTVNGKEYTIVIDQEETITVNGEEHHIDFQQMSQGGPLSLLIDNRSLEAIVDERDDAWEVLLHGDLYTVQVQDERSYRLAQARGDQVSEGQTVVILESMKMENELRAARHGVVTQVRVAAGDSVEKNQDLVTIGDVEEEE